MLQRLGVLEDVAGQLAQRFGPSGLTLASSSAPPWPMVVRALWAGACRMACCPASADGHDCYEAIFRDI